jgi:glycosyltransferase involved in cell wall biosynthesis
MVRDEEDIVGYTVAHLITEGVDGIIVANNLSKDRTQDILEVIQAASAVPVIIVQDKEEAYYQAVKMNRLAEMARQQGADYIIPFDADELWVSSNAMSVKEVINCEKAPVLGATVIDHRPTSVDDLNVNPIRRMCYRRIEPLQLKKMCFSPAMTKGVITQGNHAVADEKGRYLSYKPSALRIRHFPLRSPEQMLRKVLAGGPAYEKTDLPLEVGGHWRGWYSIYKSSGAEAVKGIFMNHYYHPEPWQDNAIALDPAPLFRMKGL